MLSGFKKTSSTRKVTFWEASKRPMFVKSVWVEDEGYRHFILNSDECQKKRNEFRASRKAQTMQNQVFNKMAKDLSDLSLPKIEATEVNQPTNDQYLTVPTKHHSRQLQKQQTVETDHYDPEENTCQPTTDLKLEDGKIQLTERVLQWLDLAGKQTLIHNELTRGEQPKLTVSRDHAILRRVQTTESLMSMTSVKTLRPVPTFSARPIPRIAVRRVSTTESLVNNGSLHTRPDLRRSESLHQLSLTFDEGGEDLPELPPPEKFSGIRFDIFPATLRCSKKFLSCVHSRNMLSRSHSDVSTYSEATTVAPPTEETSKRKRYPKHLLRKSSTLEQRYKSIISRHILETACNEQNLKRQLHIFLPKSRTANECESCLSTIISDVSKS